MAVGASAAGNRDENMNVQLRLFIMWIRRGLLPAAVALAVATIPVSAQQAATKITVPYETFTLPNGLNVILHEDHSVPIVSVNMWYYAGSANEKPGRTGF